MEQTWPGHKIAKSLKIIAALAESMISRCSPGGIFLKRVSWPPGKSQRATRTGDMNDHVKPTPLAIVCVVRSGDVVRGDRERPVDRSGTRYHPLSRDCCRLDCRHLLLRWSSSAT